MQWKGKSPLQPSQQLYPFFPKYHSSLEDQLILDHNVGTWHGPRRRAAGLSEREVLPPFKGSGEEWGKEKKKKAASSRGSQTYKRKMKWVVKKCVHTRAHADTYTRVTAFVSSYKIGQYVSLFSALCHRMVLRKLLRYASEVALEVMTAKGIGIMNEQQGEV